MKEVFEKIIERLEEISTPSNFGKRWIYIDKVIEIVNQVASEFNLDQDSPKTSADRIRSMSDEELAEWIHNICQFENADDEEPMISIYNLDTKLEETIHDSYGDLLDWLQSEVEE